MSERPWWKRLFGGREAEDEGPEVATLPPRPAQTARSAPVARPAPPPETPRPQPAPAARGIPTPRPAAPAPAAPTPATGFRIRRIDPPPAPRTPTPAPPPVTPVRVEPASAEPVDIDDPPHAAGLFAGAGPAVAFIAAVARSTGAERVLDLRRATDGRWWVAVDVPADEAAPLAWMARGAGYAGEGALWIATRADGRSIAPECPRPADHAPALVRGAAVEHLDAPGWSPAVVRDLVGALPLALVPLRGHLEVRVLLPAALAPWALRRSLALGLTAQLQPVRHRSLTGDGPATRGLELRLRGDGRDVPLTWLRALADLPGVLVARPSDADAVWVDVRHRAPLADDLLRLLPLDTADGETWLLAGPDVGHRRVAPTGRSIDGASLVAPPSIAVTPPPPADGDRLPAPAPARLIHDGHERPLDAVLIDGAELDWLRRWLRARPLGEEAWIVPGDGRHLVLGAGIGAIPFGVELTRVGPGGLYVERTHRFDPPLPLAASRAAFGDLDREPVAVTAEGAWRLRVDALMPAWSLWAAAAPAIDARVPDAAARALAQAARALQPAAKPVVPLDKVPAGPPTAAAIEDRARLRHEAARAETRGDLRRAAGLLEEAGDAVGAGRLYARIAFGGAARSHDRTGLPRARA